VNFVLITQIERAFSIKFRIRHICPVLAILNPVVADLDTAIRRNERLPNGK
jgi:hypothetical protein